MEKFVGHFLLILKKIKLSILKWSAENPGLALGVTIIIAGSVLPFISALALLPLVAVSDIGHYLQKTDIFTILNTVFGQGSFLGLVLLILFIMAFLVGTIATCIHYFIRPHNRKKYTK